MQLARVEGTILAPAAHPSLRGGRHLLMQGVNEHGESQGSPFIALDPLGAGLHQIAVVSSDGATTRKICADPYSPLRQLIIALVD